jgi:hypothetical protein
MQDSQESGAGADDVYVPKVYWFAAMDSFLRPKKLPFLGTGDLTALLSQNSLPLILNYTTPALPSQASSCGICGGQNVALEQIFFKYFDFPCQSSFHQMVSHSNKNNNKRILSTPRPLGSISPNIHLNILFVSPTDLSIYPIKIPFVFLSCD